MYEDIQKILNVLWYDEELLRLLHYKPEDMRTNTPDPLSPTLPNIMDMPEYEQWNIREKVIMLTPKDDNIIGDRKCVIFAFLGNRRANRGNFLTADQNVIFDVYCHADYENGDMRSARIGDKLNDLFALRNIAGIGKMDFKGADVISRVPSQYVAYRYIFDFVNFKKDSVI